MRHSLMAKRETNQLRQWAVLGAEQRLVQLADEARAIFVAFPELRARGRGFEALGERHQRADGDVGGRHRGATTKNGRRRRRKLSAEASKRISDAQKARWAKQKSRRG